MLVLDVLALLFDHLRRQPIRTLEAPFFFAPGFWPL